MRDGVLKTKHACTSSSSGGEKQRKSNLSSPNHQYEAGNCVGKHYSFFSGVNNAGQSTGIVPSYLLHEFVIINTHGHAARCGALHRACMLLEI
jgi:hypothetical protein